MPTILPVDEPGPSRTGTLVGPTAKTIEKVLGFKANIQDDAAKVKYSWGFTVDGKFAAIWDYYGSWRERSWSTYDPHKVLPLLFPGEC
jgi:hypothetical protein